MANGARAAGEINIVRDLAGRVGPVIGSAQACRDIGRPRIQAIVDKFSLVIREASANEAERSDLTQVFDRSVADGRTAVTSGRMDCGPRRPPACPISNGSIAGPSLSSVIGPSSAAAATAAQSGNRADGSRSAGPDRPLPARHHRTGNQVWNCGPVLRRSPGTGTADEARDRDRLQSRQRMPAASMAGCSSCLPPTTATSPRARLKP